MGFHEVQLPTDQGYTTRGGPGHRTLVSVTPGGAEERVAKWGSARRRYSVVFRDKTTAAFGSLLAFYLARQGALYGFRNKDWGDYASTATGRTPPFVGAIAVSNQDQVIGTGDGVTTVFQLTKTYTSGPSGIVRKITKPIASTVLVALNITAQTSGWTVDDTTGLITFTTPPGAGVSVRAGFEFDVPVRFDTEADDLFEGSLDTFDSSSMPNVGLIELVDEDPISDLDFHGGAKSFGVVIADISITANTGRLISGEPQTVGLKVFLPDAKPYVGGGPWWLIVNKGTEAWSVRNQADVQIVSIAVNSSAEIWLEIDAGLNKVWWAK